MVASACSSCRASMKSAHSCVSTAFTGKGQTAGAAESRLGLRAMALTCAVRRRWNSGERPVGGDIVLMKIVAGCGRINVKRVLYEMEKVGRVHEDFRQTERPCSARRPLYSSNRSYPSPILSFSTTQSKPVENHKVEKREIWYVPYQFHARHMTAT